MFVFCRAFLLTIVARDKSKAHQPQSGGEICLREANRFYIEMTLGEIL